MDITPEQTPDQRPTVRRSVALPPSLVEEARKAAPRPLQDNFNLLVREALTEYIDRRRAEEFDRQMAEMASDPDLRRESQALEEEFQQAEGDGLP